MDEYLLSTARRLTGRDRKRFQHLWRNMTEGLALLRFQHRDAAVNKFREQMKTIDAVGGIMEMDRTNPLNSFLKSAARWR
ncbi:MAG: hypothetical protein ABI901_04735 [Roseiflexaceae bacterium]